jgi:HD-GYP domain-containing protein (c-di-GMP phosphodiesterase class II)
MHHTPLSLVRDRVAAGHPLPFNVYKPDTTLLLARGQVVQSTAQMESLFERGTLVDLRELRPPRPDIATLPRTELPRMWRTAMDDLDAVLRRPGQQSFTGALDDAAKPLQQLIDRDPDLAIFQVLRQEGNAHAEYGMTHSVHTAIVTQLVARRLGWSTDERERAFKAALTMNLSILELQGRLAEQTFPLTDEQRQTLHAHPQASRDLLAQAGIDDEDWLRAVAEHHEERDGSGYPSGTREPSELATLLRKADIYTAKLSPRATREAQAADRVGRELFMRDPGHPVCAALVKEFGVYPPGCFVALASGETGVVVARGSTVMTPLVAAMTNGYGAPLPEPVRRDTRQPLHAILGVLPARQMRAPLQPDKLAALID